MRPQFVISVLVLTAVALAILFWRRPFQAPVNVGQPQATAQSTNTPIATANKSTSAVAPTPTPPPSANQPRIVTGKVETPEQAKQEIESANVPVDFYGKVIDQDSNALSGVDIKITVRHWTMPDLSLQPAGSKIFGIDREIPLEQTSGTDGRFEITGATGDVFYLESIQKDGYEVEPCQRNFGAVSGSYENPFIFKMWSTNIHEKLISGGKSFDIVPDGRPYFINLTDDTISESGTGDLKVWIQYTNQIVRGQVYDWSAGIEVINGGLLEEPLGSAMYGAPTDGYVPAFQLQGQIKGGQRGDIGERQFYLRLSNGQEYGQMSIGLYAPFNDQTPGLIHLSYAINPSGSRILR